MQNSNVNLTQAPPPNDPVSWETIQSTAAETAKRTASAVVGIVAGLGASWVTLGAGAIALPVIQAQILNAPPQIFAPAAAVIDSIAKVGLGILGTAGLPIGVVAMGVYVAVQTTKSVYQNL